MLATLLAVSMPLGAAPAQATPLAPLALFADAGKVTAAQASSDRKPIQERAADLLKAGKASDAAEVLSEEAGKRSDPVLYIDAAEAFTAAGEQDKSKSDLESAIERARIGLDILYFLQDTRADPDWVIVESGDIPAEIRRGEKAIEASEAAIANLDKKVEAPTKTDAPEEKKQRKKAPRDGRGLIATGSVLTLVGVGGLGLMGFGLASAAGAQKDIEALAEQVKSGEIDQATFDMKSPAIDDKGELGNTLTYAGAAVGAVGLAAGIALLVVGVKKRKKYRAANAGDESDSTAMIVPSVGRGSVGLLLSGRF
jgi:tetratricopeptide (TPR) repeat protein